MEKEMKIVQVKIIDASENDVAIMVKAFNELKKKLPFDMEFLVTNEKVEIRDIKFLITELYNMYKDGDKITKKKTKSVEK